MNLLKRFSPVCSLLITVAMLMVLSASSPSHAAVVGTLQGVSGAVDVMTDGKLPARTAKNGDKVYSGDFIRTKSGAYAEVVYSDGTVLRISQRSRVDVGEHFSGKSPDRSEVRLTRGKLQAIVDLTQVKASGGGKKFEVRTPNAIAGVRGTDFFVSHERSVTGIFVRTGSVYGSNPVDPSREVILTPGTLTTVQGDRPPSPPRPALPSEIRQFEQGLTAAAESGATPARSAGQAGTGTTGTSGRSGSDGTTSNRLYTVGDPLAPLPGAVPAGPILPPPPPPPPTPAPPPPIPPAADTIGVKINVDF